ncbi:MAG TPA: asparagine synthase (glutamine-hydrolyzing) [Myxococcaceae bacterium]|jgi:asparagine synthase (glutamine-hydrolysing)|nr:asparagine synthase (glutamine-hydrolyzing) [Myxococcaceae bacterium]
MCGIAGEVRFDAPPDADAVRRMADALAHRGPDAEGFAADGTAALGHRRLSILDLVGGVQPMQRDGVTLVFNGQAYDFAALRAGLERKGHRFTTRSDTEVVLRAYLEWGEDVFPHLDGMFAVALWDARSRKLLLGRDRMGKKPLHLALAQRGRWHDSLPAEGAPATPVDRLVFGSELKALVAHGGVPRSLSRPALIEYLATEAVPAPRTIWTEVHKLPPAHVAVLDASGLRLRRYWELPVPRPSPGSRDAAAELRGLLDSAVAKRLVADVPVGIFLSGGIDSTALTALAVRHAPRIHSFSIGFEEASFDESAHARLAADALGTEHHLEMLSGRACLELLPCAVDQLDEPFADPSYLPTHLLSRFVRRSVKVALAGDGGDELFAGYDPFLAHRPAALLARLPGPLLGFLAGAAARLPAAATNMSFDFRLKQLFRGLTAPASLRHAAWIGAFLPEELGSVLHPDLRPLAREEVAYRAVLAEAERAHRAGISPGSVDEALRFYLTGYLVDDILVKADRASMAASLEVRAPFLDTRVVEFAVGQSWQAKLSLTRTKVLLRSALRGLVPEPILARPKKGFGIPVAQWIRGPLRPLFEDLFSESSLRRAGVFAPEPTRALLERHLGGAADLRKPLWTAAMFLLWQRRWAAGAGP